MSLRTCQRARIPGDGIGKDVFANPIATVWADSMMLEFLGETESAALLMRAIETQTAEGKLLTPDLGGSARTWEVGEALAQRVRQADRRSGQTS